VLTLKRFGENVNGVKDALSIGSKFGRDARPFREIMGIVLKIHDPRRRLLYSENRGINYGYMLGNFFWSISGSSLLNGILFYNRRGVDFSDDAVSVAAAPGERMFSLRYGNQFGKCVSILKRDPASRRAVISLYSKDDAGSVHRDCPCFLTIQFLIRQNRLDAIATCRSQSALMVLPYDSFLHSMIQECMSAILGVDLGSFYLQIGSCHYYLDEECLVDAFLDEEHRFCESMSSMPTLDFDLLHRLVEFEEDFRRTKQQRFDGLPQYWIDFFHALELASNSDTVHDNLTQWGLLNSILSHDRYKT
jgi:thymidylate synthase